MKLKRTKLAALAMTALMAVSAMSLVSYAATDTDVAATVADVDGGTLITDGDNAYVFSYPTDGSYTITYYVEKDDEVYGPYTTTATASTKAATCTEPGEITLTATILGTEISQTYSTADAKGHTWVAIDVNTTESATHVSSGSATVTYECSVCGETKTEYGVELSQQEHEWSDTLVYEPVSNVYLDSNGLPQLIDDSYDGYYNVKVYCVDYGTTTVKGETDYGVKYVETNVVIYAKTVYSAAIIDQAGIADTLKGNTYSYAELSQLPLDNDSIELEDCEKDGSYVIAYYNQGGEEISRKTVTVTAHHMEVVFAEFSSADDLSMCTVTYNSAHTAIKSVYNKSCYQTITYSVVTHCTAACCRNTDDDCTAKYVYETSSLSHDGLKKLSSVTATAAPDGEHTIYTEAKTAIDAAVATGNTTYDTYEYLYNLVKDNYSKYVVLKNNTSTCTEDGTVEVHYLCMV
ncbi:MAG: hypothetical protein LUF30_04405, partial [Lachnospiraceae bacterium]|nr:hypothetical protein [Lachnospiraceae bacterium]